MAKTSIPTFAAIGLRQSITWLPSIGRPYPTFAAPLLAPLLLDQWKRKLEAHGATDSADVSTSEQPADREGSAGARHHPAQHEDRLAYAAACAPRVPMAAPRMMPWLTQDEIDDLCKPLKQAAAQIRFMTSLGLTVRTKPNGAPLVVRSHFDQVMNPTALSKPASRPKPNWDGLEEFFASKRRNRIVTKK